MAKGVIIDGAGPALVRLREAAGFLTVDAAAAAFQVERSLIYKYEAGKVGVPELYLQKLANVLKQSLTAVVLECLKERYPELARGAPAKFFALLVREIK